MAMTTPYEKRRGHRNLYQERGFLRVEGEDPLTLRIRDTAPTGIGAYSRKPVPIGARGVLDVKLEQDDLPRPYRTEVRWCSPSDDRSVALYSFRLGLAIISASQAAAATVPTPRPEPNPESGAGYRVKGSMLIDFVKMVRLHHDRPWDKYLTLDDMNLFHDMIIPAKWYPLAVFRRVGTAVHQIFGKGRPESARQWGRDLVARIPEDLYKNFFAKNDPARAIANYVNVNMRIFDFLRFQCETPGPGRLLIHAAGDPAVAEHFPEIGFLGLILAGVFEELARRNRALAPAAEVLEKPLGPHLLTISVQWVMPS